MVGVSRNSDTADEEGTVETVTSDLDNGPSAQILEFESRLDALSTQVSSLRDHLEQAQIERTELREEIEQLRAEKAALQRQTEQLDARTDLLELVKNADTVDGEQRSIALIQHLKRAAEQKRQRDQTARASVTHQEAKIALHHPDVDRTTIYDDMRRAARLVGDKHVLWYDSSSGGKFSSETRSRSR